MEFGSFVLVVEYRFSKWCVLWVLDDDTLLKDINRRKLLLQSPISPITFVNETRRTRLATL